MKKWRLCLTGVVLAAACLTGCQQKDPEPGEVAGYDEGEEYLSIWVHSIEDTEEGQAYKESVDSFNEAYDGKYFADIEFVPRNDSGGGYSDKVNAQSCRGDCRTCSLWMDPTFQPTRPTGASSPWRT